MELALALGADEVGFVFEPSSPRFIQRLPDWVSPNIEAYAVFGPLPTPLPIIDSLAVQYIPDWSSPLMTLSERMVRPVLRPKSDTDWVQVKDRLAESGISELVLDPYHPDAYGGTGKTLDDLMVETARKILPVKLIIAGGLAPQNVAEVIRRHQPYGVDVSSGIEVAPGIKDHEKLRRFLQEAGKNSA